MGSGGNGRQLPWSGETEISVLGGMLVDADAARDARDLLDPDHFHRQRNRHVFRALCAVAERGDVPDAALAMEELKSAGKLDEAGGPEYLSKLLDAVSSAAPLEGWVRTLRQKAALRAAIRGCGDTIREARDAGPGEVEGVLDAAESRILAAGEVLSDGADRSAASGELAERFLRRVAEAQQQPGGVTGLSTGFPDLDRLTRGLDPGDLCVVAGRPSMGKTALSLDVVRHAVLRKGVPAAVFNLEMPGETVVGRILCAEAGLDYQKTVTGRVGEAEANKLHRAAGRVREAPLTVESPSSLNLYRLRSRARKLHRRDALGLLVVDYLQLMDGPSDAGNREQEVARLSRGLKSIALELEVPVLAISQLSRAPENRPGSNRPRLSDLRESGAIEQDADLVLFVYREEMYVDPSEDRWRKVRGEAEVIVGKQRNGPTGTVELYFRKSPISFASKSRRGEEEEAA